MTEKSEQEIIEEIIWETMPWTFNYLITGRGSRDSIIQTVKKALQKGKELGANECILEGKPDKGHPIPVYCPACFDESIEELEKENKELKEKIKVLDDCFQGSMEDFTKLLKQNSKLADEIDERYKNSLHPQKITDCWHKKMIKKLRGEK